MRRLVHFSCGAASAVAAKLTIAAHGHENVCLVNAFLKEEHEDNRRFLKDCERWLDHPITVIWSEKYSASTDAVWAKRKYMTSYRGAATCSEELKQKVLDRFAQASDIHVLGYTSEEEDRLAAIRRVKPHWAVEAPLIDKNLGKADCLGMIQRAGIELPAMYRMGFNNANCIGCPKGGEGYWNKVRTVFPQRFIQVSTIQEAIGPGAYFFRNRKTGERFGLKDLDPRAGRHDEPEFECSFFCAMAEQEIEGVAC